jgi:excisionase family DNA binding protein
VLTSKTKPLHATTRAKESPPKKVRPRFEPIAVTVQTGCGVAGVGRTTLLDAVYAGEVGSFKIGTRRLIDYQSLREWVERHRV